MKNMTAWELNGILAQASPNAVVNFKVNVDAYTIKELTEDNACFKGKPLYYEGFYMDDSDVDINLSY